MQAFLSHAKKGVTEPRTAVASKWYVVVLSLFVLGGGAYSNCFENPFIFDDLFSIESETAIRQLWPPLRALWILDESPFSGRPIVSYSFAINYAIHGYSVAGYHLLNLVLHCLCGVSIIVFCRQLCYAIASEYFWSRVSVDRFTWLIGVVWLVHPMNTEVINYVTQRTEILFGLFYLLTLIATQALWSGSRIGVVLVGLLSWLSVFCKESAVTLPIMTLAIDLCLGKKGVLEILSSRFYVYLALLSSWIPLGFILSQNLRRSSVGFHLGMSGVEYLLTQGWVVGRYITQAILPTSLLLDYGEDLHLDPLDWAPGAVLLLCLFAFTCFGVVRRQSPAILGVWFFVLLAPTSSIVPIVSEVGAERRMYLPLVAVIVLAVFSIRYLVMRYTKVARTQEVVMKAIFSAIILVYVGLTFTRNTDYHSAVNIWKDATEKLPGNARAFSTLSFALAEASRFKESEEAALVAVELKPFYTDAWCNLSNALYVQGRYSEAREAGRRATECNPDSKLAHFNVGRACEALGEWSLAEDELRRAQECSRGDFVPSFYLGLFYMKLRRLQDAAKEFRNVLSVVPGNADAHANLGYCITTTNETEAQQEFLLALELEPKHAPAMVMLGEIYVKQGRLEEGKALFSRVVRENPGSAIAVIATRNLKSAAGEAIPAEKVQ